MHTQPKTKDPRSLKERTPEFATKRTGEMAAAIAQITQENGACTMQDLLQRGFRNTEIAAFGDEATELAAVTNNAAVTNTQDSTA